MEVSLRKANAFEKALTEAARKVQPQASVTLSIHEENVEAALDTAFRAFESALARAATLMCAATALRAQIGEQNAVSGINGLLRERAAQEAAEKRLSSFIDVEVRPSAVQVSREIASLSERLKSSSYASDSLKVAVVTEATREQIRADLRGIRRAKQRIADNLLELNTRSTIRLASSTVEALRAEGIID